VVLQFDIQECISRPTLMHKGGYYQKNKDNYSPRYWINKLIDNRKVSIKINIQLFDTMCWIEKMISQGYALNTQAAHRTMALPNVV
jgi:hypothetical protein